MTSEGSLPADRLRRRGPLDRVAVVLVDLPSGDVEPGIAAGVVRAVSGHDRPAVAAGLRVGISARQAVGPARDVDALIGVADADLNRAKDAGRGQAVGAGFHPPDTI